ncbi:XdhC family protein [Oceanibaculum nanhaiense]|uniref:XdhC family protein n=1 Tax=Oceanibaculum nanhaiense TaxID=1909734 RepID=UPI003D2880BB
MQPPILKRLLEERAAQRPVALVTRIEDGLQCIVMPREQLGDLALKEDELARVRASLAEDRSGMIEGGYFVHVHNPPLRLILVGAVHIAQALAPMAAIAGYRVVIVDPRRAFATDERFPGITLDDRWPDEALEDLQPNRRTAVVTLTHDPKLDDPALMVALKSDAFYIGCLGSRKTHASRLERLTEAGFGSVDFQRIHGPLGLDIGAITPAEIAISALAEITQVLRRKTESETPKDTNRAA